MHIPFLWKEIMVIIFKDVNAWKIIGREMRNFSPCVFWVSQNLHICTQLPDDLGRVRKETEKMPASCFSPLQAVPSWTGSQQPRGSFSHSALRPPRPVPHPSGKRKLHKLLHLSFSSMSSSPTPPWGHSATWRSK